MNYTEIYNKAEAYAEQDKTPTYEFCNNTLIDAYVEGAQAVSKSTHDYIDKLMSESFDGWSDDEIRGYKTALISIRESINI